MKNRFLLLSVSSLLLVACQPKTGKQTQPSDSSTIEMKTKLLKIEVADSSANDVEEGYTAGVSGAFVGMLNGKIIQAGGCNFPVDPLAPDSKKKFYEGIYEIEVTSDSTWTPIRIGTLPEPMAYGQAATVPDGLVLVGGSDASDSFSSVYLLKMTNKGTELTELPFLPGKLDNFAITSIGAVIYTAGGNFNGQPSKKVFKLEPASEVWEELPEFPGNPRVQPVLAHGKDETGSESIYLWGGFAGKGENREASLNSDGLKFNLANKMWTQISSPKNEEGQEISTGGGCTAILDDGKIAVTGGVNKDIFLSALQHQPEDYLTHSVGWYRFNPHLLIFNPRTEKWEIALTTENLARAGAGMVVKNNQLIVSGGELKPRIRTANIFTIEMKVSK